MKELLKSGSVGYIGLDKSILIHDFKDFKRTEKGKEMVSKYLERWHKLGFTQGLSGEREERVAVAMEQFAVYMLTEGENNEEGFKDIFEVIGFPMIRRIVNTVDRDDVLVKLKEPDSFKFLSFIKYLKEIDFEKLLKEIEERSNATANHIDVEAEACTVACELMIEKFNGTEASFDELEENYIKKLKEKDERLSSDNTNA